MREPARTDVSQSPRYRDRVSYEPSPWEPPIAGSESEHLTGALDRLRATFRWKADGLTADQLGQRIPSSDLTIAALLKHLAHVETDCFTRRLDGSALGEPWDSIDWDVTPDWDFESAADDSAGYLYELYDTSVVNARARLQSALARAGMDQSVHLAWPDGRHINLRRLVCDFIEEYGRHTGHADLIREAIDGRVGEDPDSAWTMPAGW